MIWYLIWSWTVCHGVDGNNQVVTHWKVEVLTILEFPPNDTFPKTSSSEYWEKLFHRGGPKLTFAVLGPRKIPERPPRSTRWKWNCLKKTCHKWLSKHLFLLKWDSIRIRYPVDYNQETTSLWDQRTVSWGYGKLQGGSADNKQCRRTQLLIRISLSCVGAPTNSAKRKIPLLSSTCTYTCLLICKYTCENFHVRMQRPFPAEDHLRGCRVKWVARTKSNSRKRILKIEIWGSFWYLFLAVDLKSMIECDY